MSPKSVVEQLLNARIIPVFYHSDPNTCCLSLEACYRGGVRVFEFTNRGPDAPDNFAELKRLRDEKYPELALGIGSILNANEAKQFIEIGTDFIVAPILDEATAQTCKEFDTPWVPGCGTLTEIVKGNDLGAPLVKLFPGSVLGPDFVKAALGPVPNLKLMPTGGVDTSLESLSRWFYAGVVAVGMGSQLIKNDGDYESLENRVKQVFERIESILNKNPN
jgi:2-dehydro-3-deoxyphosphogluconate aldolase/(4S)-4-hydroxy-2-oxoglutarate aldolase